MAEPDEFPAEERPKVTKRPRAPRAPEPSFGVWVLRSNPHEMFDAQKPGSTMHECMVGDCDMALVIWPAKELGGENLYRLAAAVGIQAAAEAMTKEVAAWTDKKLREHLESHDVIEWAETVRDLEDANASWEERCSMLHGSLGRSEETVVELQRRLQASQDALHELETRRAPRERTKDPMRGAQSLPPGIPMPVQDPMRERIIPSDQRAEGQVARKS